MPTRTFTHPVARALVAAAVISGAGACGGTRAVTDADRALAHMEGVYQCDVSRFAFEDLDEVDARLDAALGELSVDRESYRDFKDFLADSPELLTIVEEAYVGRC